MKLRLTLGVVGCMLTILAFNILPAQANDYGTNRQRRTCPSRTEPSSGRISAEQAAIYVACYYEEKPVFNAAVEFVDVLSVEVASEPRQARTVDFGLLQIDIEKPIYDIRGSIVVYKCQNITESYPRGQNCRIYREPESIGKCYQTTFADWYCVLGGPSATPNPERTRVPAPQ
jgi:hypothetical protein